MARPNDYDCAANRWAGLGPYYAMFPKEFADRVVRRYTTTGDLVLDPFAGRGTSVFSAASQERTAIGIEINPVGFVYARTKLAPAEKDAVASRIRSVARASHSKKYESEARVLPKFFRRCFTVEVRRYLLAARNNLDWRRTSVDRTTMAMLLVYLHGKSGAALSNQMRQTKSMSPDYALRWWEEHNLTPPELDPVEFLLSRLDWRYARGIPECQNSKVYLGNSLDILPRVADQVANGIVPKAKLLFTSPPYCGVTNYHYDQWLRLWLLGGPPNALLNGNGHAGKFEHHERYERLLQDVFARAKKILHRNATVYVRTDARQFTRTVTVSVLKRIFPNKKLSIRLRPVVGKTQTELFGDSEKKVGEIDLVLNPA